MKKNKKIETVCESCDGSCNIKHDLDEKYYTIKYCPFCGEELSDIDEDETDEEIEYDEDYNDED